MLKKNEIKYLKARSITNGIFHYFFGYYDKTPWDLSGKLMLIMESKFMDRPPNENDSLKICLINLQENSKLIHLTETRAWNWQQGCMLQWLPRYSDKLIIFNDRRDQKFVSVIYDIYKGEIKTLPMAIYTLSHDGKKALSLNFSRLAKTRPGYGYVGVPDIYEKDLAPKNDGIYKIDIETGKFELIISIAQMAAYKPRKDMIGSIHWFNHLLFNPNDQRFIFLHRWSDRPGGKRKTRLFTANLDGSDIYLLADEDMTSHFDWYDDDHILAWARSKSAIDWHAFSHYKRLFSRKGNDFYFLFRDRSKEKKIIGKGILKTDGHCSYSSNREWILTDTYPDANGYRTLILYNDEEKRRVDIGKFFSPPELIGEIRCDFHPRWNRDGSQICFDSVHEGRRKVYIMNVDSIMQ